MASRRTSTRARTVKRYTNDAFEGLDLDDDDPTSSEPPEENDSDADGEFDGAADGEAAEEDDEDDDASIAESSNGSAPEEDDDGSVVMMLSDDEELVGAAPGAPRRKGKNQGKKNFKPGYLERAENSAFKTGSFAKFTGKGHQAEESERKLSSRGVPEMYHNTGKDTRFMNLFGPAEEDVWPAVEARDRWHDRPTLPTRKEHRGEGGFAYNRYYTDQCRQHEASKGWEWYHDKGGSFAFKFKQKSKQLSASEAAKYMPQTDGPNREVLFGPITKPRLHTLKPDDAVNMAQFWDAKTSSKKSSGRQAWTLNLCKKIQCLEWAPWLDDTQRLAIAALQRSKFPAFTEPHSAPAFVPLPSTPASVQIWGFASKVEQGKGLTMDMGMPPRKELVICMDWGPVRQLKWCPLPKRESKDESETCLGLLAGIWGDGKVRVLDVKYPKKASTQYIYMTKAAFESRPPDTVCTSVTWLSSNQIAVSCANGSMAVWDISESLLSSDVVETPRPWFYQNVHSSYILSIASAYPSHPFLVATSSMDGYLRLIDLRAPLQDTLFSQRSRTGSAPLQWHEVSQCFLTCDENYTLLALSARRFHVNMSVGRANSNILDLSASPVHPFVLVACADGMALSTNIMRKVLIAKAEMWHQTWFMHEWRRAVDKNGVVTGASNAADSRDESKKPPPRIDQARPDKIINHPGPLSRMLEGFRAEVYKLWVEAGLPNQYEGVVYNTIYEQETGVTQCAWNPNIKYAGWAAAGMGDGLLRVEDIAI